MVVIISNRLTLLFSKDKCYSENGVSDYAIKKCGAEAIEFKFGQSAKGTQPAVRIRTLKDALKHQEKGFLVYPDPDGARGLS